MIRQAWRFTLLALIGVALISGLTPRFGQAAAPGDSLEQIRARGELRVGLTNQVPMGMYDPKTQTWSGVGYEISKLVADAIGVKLVVVESTWQNIIPALQTGKIDIGTAGFYATPQRALAVWFSVPYRYERAGILIRKEDAAKFKSLDDFNAPGLTITAHIGSASEGVVTRYFPKATLKPLSTDTVVLEVQAKRVNAWVADMGTISAAAKRNPQWAMVWKPQVVFSAVPVVHIVRQGDTNLLMFLNATMEYYLTQGVISDIEKKYGLTPSLKPQ